MGIIKRGILGGFSKKVANVVGSSWKGIAYMRALPLSVANPNTPAQQGERSKFRAISQFAVKWLGSVIQPLWNKLAEQMSGYNLFIKDNIAAVAINGVIDYTAVLLTKGTIGGVENLVAVQNGSTSTIDLSWDNNSGSSNAMDTDLFCLAAINKENGEVVVVRATGDTRGDGSSNFSFANYGLGDDIIVYGWFERDGFASNSSNDTVTMS